MKVKPILIVIAILIAAALMCAAFPAGEDQPSKVSTATMQAYNAYPPPAYVAYPAPLPDEPKEPEEQEEQPEIMPTRPMFIHPAYEDRP